MKHLLSLGLVFGLVHPLLAWSQCDATSATATAALVELYTSEGCSSCPPADQRLSKLGRGDYRSDQVVPLALHVDYWDELGWKDPYAQAQFSVRQHWLTQANHHQTVFTPHFFVGGREIQSWRGDLDEAIRRVNATPARAQLRIRASLAGPGLLGIQADAHALPTAEPLELYLALTQSGLTTAVPAGENAGAVLKHDAVVRQWIGPIRLENGTAAAARQVDLPASWTIAELGVVALVQNARSGEVWQTLGAQGCLAPRPGTGGP